MILYLEEKKAMQVVENLKMVQSPTDPKEVLEYIREIIVQQDNVSYDVIFDRCCNYEKIKSILDDMYILFKEDLPELLVGKEKNEQILLLCQMIMQF